MITFFAISFSFLKLFFHLICQLCFLSLDLFRCSPHWSVNMINDGDPLAICRSSPTFKLLKAFATFAAAAARFTWASWPKPLRQRRETVLSLAFCVFSRGVERVKARESKRNREREWEDWQKVASSGLPKCVAGIWRPLSSPATMSCFLS